jgi:hypothetical protein
MRRRPRLSLRARLLTALLAVTAVFLVVLGLVAFIVFGRRVGNEFDTQLKVASQRSVPGLQGTSDLYAVYYSLRTGTGGLISNPSQTADELSSYLDGRVAARLDDSARLGVSQYSAFTIRLPDGAVLRAVWHKARIPGVNQTVVPKGETVLLVARPLSERDGPLGSVVLAEVITGLVLLGLLALCGPWRTRWPPRPTRSPPAAT